jgi:NitT/TauT family transport system substrate-binding protein
MPDGAPALAMAQMMAEDTPDDGVTYKVVDASKIAIKVTYKDEAQNADMCVMPVNLASKHLGNGENYTMLGAVTHGNLYLISKDGAEYTAENLSSLVGKKVGVLQINAVPGLTLKSTLNKYDIPWQELTNEEELAADKVNLIAITGADAVGTVAADYFMIAEPAATAQAKKGYTIVGSLQQLYGGEKGYPQAVLVAKKSLVEEKENWVKDFVSKVEEGGAWLESASGEDIVAAVSAHMEDKTSSTSLKAPLLSTAVLERCGIYFTYAAACSVEVEEFLEGLLSVSDKAAAIPQSAFYWSYM